MNRRGVSAIVAAVLLVTVYSSAGAAGRITVASAVKYRHGATATYRVSTSVDQVSTSYGISYGLLDGALQPIGQVRTSPVIPSFLTQWDEVFDDVPNAVWVRVHLSTTASRVMPEQAGTTVDFQIRETLPMLSDWALLCLAVGLLLIAGVVADPRRWSNVRHGAGA